MYPVRTIGYLPGYSGNFDHKFTAVYPEPVSISFDNVQIDSTARYNILCQCEPPQLYRDFYGMVQQNYQNYDLILAYDERLLQFPNSYEFCPVGAWVDDIELDKRDQITYLMSSKIWTNEHRMRFMILRKYEEQKTIGPFEFLMHRNPPSVPSKNPFFQNAKFHIACENQVMNNMFSEKILDCFKTKTIPIYYGCQNIHKYFNPKGILRFNTFQELVNILETLTTDRYDELLPYIEENYELAKPYWVNNIQQRIEQVIQERFFK